MGREVRRVPADWQHPKRNGEYRPLLGDSLADHRRRWDEGLALWLQGRRDNYMGGTETHGDSRSVSGWRGWYGDRPRAKDYMPDWPAELRTHLMMYEDTSEGTPISPAFRTPEELARWLADNGASALGSETATYEQWLAAARSGWAPSMVMQGDAIMSGVEFTGRSK